jgi:molecular chaperone GrpE
MNGPEGDHPAEVAENGGAPDTADAPDLGVQLADAEAKAGQFRTDYLRAVAELENVRKRAAREVDSARQFGIERFAADLLPVADTLDLALQSAATADAATLVQGQEATLRLLHKAFERAGLQAVDPAGLAFDPALHEAMAMQPAPDRPAHTVLQVIQKGWTLNGRLLRPARVIVAEPAPEAPAAG